MPSDHNLEIPFPTGETGLLNVHDITNTTNTSGLKPPCCGNEGSQSIPDSSLSGDNGMFDNFEALDLEDMDLLLPPPTGVSCFSTLSSFDDFDENATAAKSFKNSLPWLFSSQPSNPVSVANPLSPPLPTALINPISSLSTSTLPITPEMVGSAYPTADVLASQNLLLTAGPLPDVLMAPAPITSSGSIPVPVSLGTQDVEMPSPYFTFPLSNFARNIGNPLVSAKASASAAGALLQNAFSSFLPPGKSVKRVSEREMTPMVTQPVKSSTPCSPVKEAVNGVEEVTSPKVRTHPKRHRTRDQLEKCRQESSRARARKRQNRAKLNARVQEKMEEAEKLRIQVMCLESEVLYLRQQVLQNALASLESQPNVAVPTQRANPIVNYVSGLLHNLNSPNVSPSPTQSSHLLNSPSITKGPSPRQILPRVMGGILKLEC